MNDNNVWTVDKVEYNSKIIHFTCAEEFRARYGEIVAKSPTLESHVFIEFKFCYDENKFFSLFCNGK